MEKRVVFRNWWLPYALVAPQIVDHAGLLHLARLPGAGTSLFIEDAFGFSRTFVWLDNFTRLFSDAGYLAVVLDDARLRPSVTVISMGMALALALRPTG
jgi:sn-glycerol 3-phosphate transport system permease protein